MQQFMAALMSSIKSQTGHGESASGLSVSPAQQELKLSWGHPLELKLKHLGAFNNVS